MNREDQTMNGMRPTRKHLPGAPYRTKAVPALLAEVPYARVPSGDATRAQPRARKEDDVGADISPHSLFYEIS